MSKRSHGLRGPLGVVGCAGVLAILIMACRQPESGTPSGQPVAPTGKVSKTPPRPIEAVPPPGGISKDEAFTLRGELISDPGIINAHEHVGHDGKSITTLESANAAVGIIKTVLLGSARHTLRLDKSGFIQHHDNNEYICKLARENPDKYWAFVTFDPLESGIVEKLAEYRSKGATGVKLYLGHGEDCGQDIPFHSYALDDSRILPLYEYCEKNRLPILLHTNLRRFEPEMQRLLHQFPNLILIMPHFGLKLGRLSEFDALMQAHPSVYVDISFGWPTFQFEGLQRIDELNESVRAFFVKYQDRILFGTDAVPTPGKDEKFVTDTFMAYRSMLELSEYDFIVHWRSFDYHEHFKGLSLSDGMLRKIYHENFERLMESAKSEVNEQM